MDIAGEADGADEERSILHVPRVMSGTLSDLFESVLQGVFVREDRLGRFFQRAIVAEVYVEHLDGGLDFVVT